MNFLKYYGNIKNDKDKLVQEYFNTTKNIIHELEENGHIIDSYKKHKKMSLKCFFNVIQIYYDKLSELQYRIQRFDDIKGSEIATYKDDENKDSNIYIRAVNESLKSWLNLLQFRYLKPAEIRLSEYNVRESIYIAVVIFILSVFVSITGYFISLQSNKEAFRKKNIILENQDSIINKLNNHFEGIKPSTPLFEGPSQ